MPIRYSSSGGTPFGDTSNRPSSPSVGQTYYNGQLGYLEIYTVSGWIPATGANDFSLNITGTNTTVTFSQTYSSGSYSIVSFLNDASLDIYAYATDGSLAGYTNTKAFTATQRFNKMVILGGSYGDVLQFSYKTTYATSASTTDVTAGPYITSITPSGMPNQNDTVTITGGNFATDVAVAFTGTGYSSTAAKSVVRSSSTSLIVTRPDNFPVSGSPYTVTVTNPSVANQPTGSAVHQYSPVTAGVVPVWQTSSTINSTFYSNVSTSLSLSATDADGNSTITYSYVSGSLPTGLTFNASTGVISGTATTAGQSTNYTVRATDSGGNTADRTFTITVLYPVVSGGTLASDATYYYRTFTGNGTLSVTGVITGCDVLLIAGGGGGGYDVGSGGGAGGLVEKNNYTISNGSYGVTIGNGGPGSIDSNTAASVRKGNNSTLGSLLTAIGGGGSGSWNQQVAGDGGSGGGGAITYGSVSGVGGLALQPSSASGGYGYPGGLGTGSGSNNYSGAAGGGGAGGAGGAGTTSWTIAGDTVNGAGGIGKQITWIPTSLSLGDPNYYSWFAGGGGASTDTPYTSPYVGWGYGGKGGGGDGSNRVINNGSQNGYLYIDGKPNTGSGGGGGGAISGGTNPGNSGNNGGNGGSGICVIRYTRASVGG